MPLNSKGSKILAAMTKQYGGKKGKSVFYASINKGTINGVEGKAEGGASIVPPPPIEPQAPAGLDMEKLRRMMALQRQIMQGRKNFFSPIRGNDVKGNLAEVTAPVTAGRMNPEGWQAFLDQAPESQNIEDRRGLPLTEREALFRSGRDQLREQLTPASGPYDQYVKQATEGGRPNLEMLSKIAASMAGGMAEGGKVADEPIFDALENAAKQRRKDMSLPPKKAQGGYTNLSPPWYARHAMKGLGLKSTKGFLNSAVPGRTDRLPLDVAPGSYVVPADIVSALGQGNSMAGAKMLKKMFGAPKMAAGGSVSLSGTPIAQETKMFSGTKMNKYGGGRFRRPGIKGLRREQYEMAEGGEASQEDVPIIAAGGEFLLSPDEVAVAGRGDVDAGHNVLDAFVKSVRKEQIATLRNLKPPKKD